MKAIYYLFLYIYRKKSKHKLALFPESGIFTKVNVPLKTGYTTRYRGRLYGLWAHTQTGPWINKRLLDRRRSSFRWQWSGGMRDRFGLSGSLWGWEVRRGWRRGNWVHLKIIHVFHQSFQSNDVIFPLQCVNWQKLMTFIKTFFIATNPHY